MSFLLTYLASTAIIGGTGDISAHFVRSEQRQPIQSATDNTIEVDTFSFDPIFIVNHKKDRAANVTNFTLRLSATPKTPGPIGLSYEAGWNLYNLTSQGVAVFYVEFLDKNHQVLTKTVMGNIDRRCTYHIANETWGPYGFDPHYVDVDNVFRNVEFARLRWRTNMQPEGAC